MEIDRVNSIIDHVERKVPKYENHKIRERKVNSYSTLTFIACRVVVRVNLAGVAR